MFQKIEISFAEKVDGVIWKTLADPERKRLFLEIRNHDKKRVTFSAIDFEGAQWLWKDVQFEEPWWISLHTVTANILLFTLYTDTNNPDQKGVLAFDIDRQKIAWWRNGFVINAHTQMIVFGVDTKFGTKQVALNLQTGEIIDENRHLSQGQQNFVIVYPFQYPEGNAHFETVRGFLQSKCQISPIISLEYCEYHSLIFISAFIQQNDLANYLFVFNSSGELMLKERLGEGLKGIALDTFFIFSGFLIFVKNKCELVSYKLV